MKVMVSLENRFLKTPDGSIYSTTVCDYSFWQRYLQVFDEVLVFARVQQTAQEIVGKPKANGPGVVFIEVPTYIGPWQYLRSRRKLKTLSAKAVTEADAFILRIPGPVSNLIWESLKTKKLPYGVEVVGSSRDSYKTCGANVLVKSILWFSDLLFNHQQVQCKNAFAAAYVTEHYLQTMYPPGGWTTHYSSIDLDEDAILNDAAMERKLQFLQGAIDGKRAFRIGHAGTMSAKYKAQDVLLEAVASCRSDGMNLELHFLGDGKYRTLFERKAHDLNLGDAVKFHGKVPAGRPVREFYDQSDLFVLPSLTEGLPRVLIEAMARGLPCVASDVGGIPELVDAEFLVQPGASDILAKKIAFLLNNPAKLLEASKKNLLKSKEYRRIALDPRRVAFYEKIAESAKRLESNHDQAK